MTEKGPKTSNGKASESLEQAVQQLDNVANVPIAIMKRVNALKNIQLKMLDTESKFYEDLHLLECKYAGLFEPLYEKRKQVINGEYEPNEEESKWVLDDDLDLTTEESKPKDAVGTSPSELIKDIKSKVSLNEIGSGAVDVKGVPDFWLQTFRSVELISDMIQEHDEPVLKHLYDVRVRLHDQKPYGYTLEFHFNDNDFFTNKVLTKTYELRTEYDQKDPFSYEGPDLYKCKGCTIEWKKGKNVTVRLVKKKQKHKGHGTIRVLTKELKQDSFFNYFDTPTPPSEGKSPVSSSTEGEKKSSKSDKEHDDDASIKDDEGLYAADFEIGHFFKERIIPKAVLYFTGEIADDECYDDYDDEDDDEDDEDNSENDDEDNDDDDEEEEQPKFDKKHGKGGKGGNKPAGGSGAGKGLQAGGDGKNNPPECKQN